MWIYQNKKIDYIIINRDRSLDRLQRLQHLFGALHLSFIRVAAINANNLDVDDIVKRLAFVGNKIDKS